MARHKNKEESWLSFNERVLQEAEDKSVPLIERLRFLGIYSNNRDEFFRVRIAGLRRLVNLKKKELKTLTQKPEATLKTLQKIVVKQEARFQKTYAKIISELEKEKIHILSDTQIKEEHIPYLNHLFKNEIRPQLVPIMLGNQIDFPWLKDRVSYLAFHLSGVKHKAQFALIELPSKKIGRFFELPSVEDKKYLILLDDIVRFFAPQIFQIFDFKNFDAYSIKVTRDAELDLDDDISKSIIDKLSKSIKNRTTGDPVRFVHDKKISKPLLNYILQRIDFDQSSYVISTGRYHNYRDFMRFPSLGKTKLLHQKQNPIPHKYLEGQKSYLNTIEKKDILLYYPYHDFSYLINLLREAAIDPEVTKIKINLYRVAENSMIVNTLINAVRNGKEVLAVIELKARFDEEANIEWSEKLQEEGVRVIFGVQGLKVHAKLILIEKKKKRTPIRYAHIGTGNFNEKTAHIYTDISLLTAHKGITSEVERVFDFFENPYKVKRYSHLFVSPFTTRRKFLSLIDNEIRNAQKGREAYIILKVNNLVDKELIEKLYEASDFGVKIKLIVRGMCGIIASQKKLSEQISAISIIDKFLEHTRIAIFCNNKNELQFISSADWMARNLDNRVEVTVPIYDSKIKKLLKKITEIQLSDNVKARIIDKDFTNKYKKQTGKAIRSQNQVYQYLIENYTS